MRRLRRWLLPLVLLVAIAAASATALAVEADAASTAGPQGGARLATPVISARRVPTVVAAPVGERRLAADLAAWLASQPPDTCLVVLHPDGRVAFDHRSDEPMVPASTAKLLTAFAALRELDPASRFRTTVVAAPPVEGVVRGDVVLVGGGDPLLASPDYVGRFRRQPQVHTDLDGLAEAIAAAGVGRVEGSVLGDDQRFDSQRYVPGWPERYIDQDQVGPLSALSVNDGFAAYPPGPDGPQDLRPADDPAVQAAAVLTELLEARGVEVVGQPGRGTPEPGMGELAAVESVPLRDVVAQMLRESDNNTAELLLKELGRSKGDPTTAGGRAVVLASLRAAGLDASGVHVDDGSGLGLANRATCAVLADVLSGDGAAAGVASGLPVAARTGTLADRFLDDTELAGVLRAKTGTLNTVTALAGVLDDGDGALTFAVVVNTAPGQVITPALVAAQQDLAAVLAAWPRLPDPAVLGPLDPLER